jgi:hypothetical protein
MSNPVQRALNHLRLMAPQGMTDTDWPITLNFHPDISVAGHLVIDSLAADGVYRSQFETGTSSGGLTAYEGGDRWNWESRIFGGAYDNEDPLFRPKYGALNCLNDPVGGSRRFGSSHFRLRSHVRARTSFSYPDSHLEPKNFAVDDASQLIDLADKNELSLDPWLDNYIEAHIHGPLAIKEDVEALILDPSFKDTRVEEAAVSLGCDVEWHDGFRLSVNRLEECLEYRGEAAANAIVEIAEGAWITPAILWRARETTLDYQTAKWVWHCIARYGYQ